MKKKILIGLGVLVTLVLGLAAYELLIASKRSPKETVAYNQGGLDVQVTYCRPYKKGRVIFGEKSAGALVPYGEYWRLGANAATRITFAKNVSFADKPVPAGSYRMYAVPAAGAWKVVLNSEPDKWGARDPDHAKDVLSVMVAAEEVPNPSEQFTISFVPKGNSAEMHFTWDNIRARVPLAAN